HARSLEERATFRGRAARRFEIDPGGFGRARSHGDLMDPGSVRIDRGCGVLEVIPRLSPGLEVRSQLCLRLLRILGLRERVRGPSWMDDHDSPHPGDAEVEIDVDARIREGQ